MTTASLCIPGHARSAALTWILAAGAVPGQGAVTVRLNPPPRPMEAGETMVFMAMVAEAKQDDPCDWAILEQGRAPEGRIVLDRRKNGYLAFTAPSGPKARSFTLRATAREDPSAWAEIRVEVQARDGKGSPMRAQEFAWDGADGKAAAPGGPSLRGSIRGRAP